MIVNVMKKLLLTPALLFAYFIGIICCFCFVGCTDSEEETNPAPLNPPSITFPDGPVSNLTLTAGGETATVRFHAAESWTARVVNASRSQSWLQVSPSQGSAGEVTLRIQAQPNEGYDERNATMMLLCGATSQSLTVTQKQKDALLLQSNKVEMGHEGGTFTLEVKANVPFESTLEPDAETWVKPVSSRGLTSHTLTFTVAPNESPEKREGHLRIFSGSLSETVTVFQEGDGPALLLTQNEYVVGSNGDTLTVEVKSNTDFEVKLPEVDWLTEVTSRALSSHTFYFRVAPNEEYDARSTEIAFVDRANQLEETVRIQQVQKDAILVACNEYQVDPAGDSLSFSVNANVNFTTHIVGDWITSVAASRGLTEHPVAFRIAANVSNQPREGKICFRYGDVEQVVRLKQGTQADKEREYLMAFYRAAHGEQWFRNDHWGSDRPLNEWYGVSLDENNQRVREIVLSFNNLSGNLDDMLKPLYGLSCLEHLNLLDSRLISGTLSPELVRLKSLKDLAIDTSHLSGEIPEEIGDMTQLTSLYLRGWDDSTVKGLSGELPRSLTKLVNLERLVLSFNYHLTGEVTFLSELPKLNCLMLKGNQFTGPLPEMGAGRWFHYEVYKNQFTGGIPESHRKVLDNMDYWTPFNVVYDVSHNNLSGTIPDYIRQHDYFRWSWSRILVQNSGYGFGTMDIPAPVNTVKCYDGSFLNLQDAYAQNKYTVVLRWDPHTSYSEPYPQLLAGLLKKYKDKGLGIIGTTAVYCQPDELEKLTHYLPHVPVFWEFSTRDDELYFNNPYSVYKWDYLFGFQVYPMLYVIDSQGHIVFFGTAPGITNPNHLPQHHENRDELFDFVAALFGDGEYIPGEDTYYTSTDYSRDGEVCVLQQATRGKGIDLVFMGEAFVDKDMEPGGKYEQKMRAAMEQFFSMEPYRSCRDRFNLYAVKVVSPNAEFALGAQHRLNENLQTCFEYVRKIPQLDQSQSPKVSVIYNTENSVGRSYTIMFSDDAFVAFMMEGVNEVLNHESGGHGFAKLKDEYVEPGNEALTLPEEEKNSMDNDWAHWGWGANVDWRSDPATVKWSHFLRDDRYAGEHLGLWEGAYLYGFGAYRPTENSMMRYNNAPFNAPSREQIYKKIMQLSEGDGWKYNYEEFVRIDSPSRLDSRAVRSLWQKPTEQQRRDWKRRHRAPVMKRISWREVRE